MLQKLLSTAEAADIIGVSRETVVEYIHAEKLSASRIGKRFKVRPEDLEAYISSKKHSRQVK